MSVWPLGAWLLPLMLLDSHLKFIAFQLTKKIGWQFISVFLWTTKKQQNINQRKYTYWPWLSKPYDKVIMSKGRRFHLIKLSDQWRICALQGQQNQGFQLIFRFFSVYNCNLPVMWHHATFHVFNFFACLYCSSFAWIKTCFIYIKSFCKFCVPHKIALYAWSDTLTKDVSDVDVLSALQLTV